MARRLLLLALIPALACGGGRAGESAAPSVQAADTTTAPAPTPARADQTADRRTAGKAGCRVERPRVWPAESGRVSWIGACSNGFAEGSGVVVRVVEGIEPERFYGHVEGGHLRVGALQTASGFIAGTWADGAPVDTIANDVAQRNTMIAAFDSAASAATSASQSFAKKGDAKTSRYYATQSKVLRKQMD